MTAIQQRAAGGFLARTPADLPLADLVLCHLPRGRAHAITIARLALLVEAPHRDVEQALQDLADSGLWPVCSSSQRPMGVWLGSRTDVAEYLERFDSRIRSMLRRRHGLRRYLASGPEPRPIQVELWQVSA